MSKHGLHLASVPFSVRTYKLDSADVFVFRCFVVRYWRSLPDDVKQSFLNLYDMMSVTYNPRNKKYATCKEST